MVSAPSGELRGGSRHVLCEELASGGMATVHLGRLRGAAGFALTVAVKRLHPTYARDPGFVSMFLDEARLAARVRHPNVVPIFDVAADDGDLRLVMEYVPGVTLGELVRLAHEQGVVLPPRVAGGIVCGALEGLHAAHEAKSEQGDPLGLVHRDVSPQNVIVGEDGVARVLDFGIARAAGRLHSSAEGVLKGKAAYLSPEQISSDHASRLSDVYAAGVVLWEALAGRRLFEGDTVGGVVGQVLLGDIPPPGERSPGVPPALDAVVLRATSLLPEARFASARAMCEAIQEAITIAAPSEVSAWVHRLAAPLLAERAALVASVERRTAGIVDPETATSIARAARGDSIPGEQDAQTVPPLPSPPLPGRRRDRLAVLVAVPALVAAALFVLLRRPAAPVGAPGQAVAAPAVAEVAPPQVLKPAPSLAPSPSAPPEPPPARASSSSRAPAAPPRSSARAASRSSCNPPYFLDADGIRNPKPECL